MATVDESPSPLSGLPSRERLWLPASSVSSVYSLYWHRYGYYRAGCRTPRSRCQVSPVWREGLSQPWHGWSRARSGLVRGEQCACSSGYSWADTRWRLCSSRWPGVPWTSEAPGRAARSDDSTIASFAYERDSRGNPTSEEDADGNVRALRLAPHRGERPTRSEATRRVRGTKVVRVPPHPRPSPRGRGEGIPTWSTAPSLGGAA